MTNDIESAVEQYGIECFQASKLLKGKSLVHFSEDKSAKPDRIVFKATVGEHRLDGPGGFSVELKATYYTSTATVPQVNLVKKAMVEAMYESTATRATVPAASDFANLVLLDDVNSEKSNADNYRESSVTFPFIARLRINAMGPLVSQS